MPKNNTTAQPEVTLVDLKVTVDHHTHAGQPVKKGESIQVPAEVAESLQRAWSKNTTTEE